MYQATSRGPTPLAAQQPRLIEQGLAAEAAFPEAASTLVFLIGAPGNRLVQAAHEPTQIGQARAPASDLLGLPGRGEALPELGGAGKQAAVAFDDLGGAPGAGVLAVDAHDQMKMVAENRVGAQAHGEDGAERGELLYHPGLAMIEAAPGQAIGAAQKGATHAAADAVVVGGGLDVDLGVAGLGHEGIMPAEMNTVNYYTSILD